MSIFFFESQVLKEVFWIHILPYGLSQLLTRIRRNKAKKWVIWFGFTKGQKTNIIVCLMD